jgi:hypothetical protein
MKNYLNKRYNVESKIMAIHRFKCSPELNDEIIKFSQIHLHDENVTLKEQFDVWLKRENISQLVDNENNFLLRHNYDTSSIDVKIFKSIKYYYIKKFMNEIQNKEEKDTTVKKRLIKRLPIELKQLIQEHLEKHFNETPNFKPADTYLLFKQNYEDNKEYENISEEVVKKCYKNQYYQMKHKKYADTLNEK